MPFVLIEKQTPQITRITLNRPERRNSLTIELLTELTDAIEKAAADESQRILILRGAGDSFCTGLDLKEAAEVAKAHAVDELRRDRSAGLEVDDAADAAHVPWLRLRQRRRRSSSE